MQKPNNNIQHRLQIPTSTSQRHNNNTSIHILPEKTRKTRINTPRLQNMHKIRINNPKIHKHML